MDDRGIIHNVERKQQINDFSQLLYGKITPTDIDGCIEYHNRLWVFFEVKYNGSSLPLGQRIALERLVKDTGTGGKKSLAVIIDHNVTNTKQSIPVGDCFVRSYFFSDVNRWIDPPRAITAKEIIDSFLSQKPELGFK